MGKDDELEEVQAIKDLPERGRRAGERMDFYTQRAGSFGKIRLDAINEMLTQGMNQTQIAKALGMTRARVGQLLTAPHRAERATLAPNAKMDATIYVVQKTETENRRGSVLPSTATAVGKLEHLAQELGVGVNKDDGDCPFFMIPAPGIVDLNQDNLIVLMGPRTSALVAQALTADPVIQWRRTPGNHWYLADTKTGNEYYSTSDPDVPHGPGEAKSCIALIGRVRRPDGHGSFLYLGGAHALGTAGAVDYFVREVGSIWEQTRRSLWSAIVVTTGNSNGHIASAELVTPIYVHGRR